MIPRAVTADELDQYLPVIAWHLGKFCENGQWEPQDLIDQIRDRQRQLRLIEGKCVLLTSVLTDRLSTVQVTHCVGVDYQEWLPLWPLIERWAKEIGAKRIEIVARPGWEWPMRQFGLTKTHVVLEKRL